MKGHIRKRPHGSYALVVDMGRQGARRCLECGARVWVREHREDRCPKAECKGQLGPVVHERRQHWETHRLRREAERSLARYIAEVDRGADPFPRRLSVEEYLHQWLDSRVPDLRPRTLHRYRELVELHLLPHLGHLRLDRVRPDDVQRTLAAMTAKGLAARTVIQARAVLNAAMVHAVRNDYLARNPVAAVPIPKKADPGLTVLLPEQVLAVLRAAHGTPWRIALLLAGMTGARRSEVLALRWADIDLAAARLTIRRSLQLRPEQGADGEVVEFFQTKTDRACRTLRLTPTAVNALRDHRREQAERRHALGGAWADLDLVCERGDGGPLHPDSMTGAFRRLARQAGLPPGARLHDLRHAVAVLLSLEGVPLVAVSAVIGHSSPTFTASVYQHLIDELTDAAAAAVERRLGDEAFAGRPPGHPEHLTPQQKPWSDRHAPWRVAPTWMRIVAAARRARVLIGAVSPQVRLAPGPLGTNDCR